MVEIELKTPKSKQTREKLLNCARELFATQGFSNVTVRDIAQQAGVGYGTVYLHFKDKKAVFDSLLQGVEHDLYTAVQGMGADLDQDYPEGLSAYRALRKDLVAIFESFKRNFEIIAISRELALTDESFSKKFFDMRKRLIDRTQRILEKSKLAHHINSKVAAVAISGMIETTASEWLNHKNPHRLDVEFRELISTLAKLYFKVVS